MTSTEKQVLARAMALPADERRRVAQALLDATPSEATYDTSPAASLFAADADQPYAPPSHDDAILAQLRAQTNTDSALFVHAFLEHHLSLSPSQLAEAVFLSEPHFITDEQLRTRFAEALLASARTLLAHDPTSLAARIALRKFASLAPAPMLDELAAFLGTSQDLGVKQTALESLWNALATEPNPPKPQAFPRSQARVLELVALYANPEWLCSSPGRVLHAFGVLADLMLCGDAAVRRLESFLATRSPDTRDAMSLVESQIRSTLGHVRDASRRALMLETAALLANRDT